MIEWLMLGMGSAVSNHFCENTRICSSVSPSIGVIVAFGFRFRAEDFFVDGFDIVYA